MRKALVQSDGRVAQIEDAANIFPVAPPLQWLDCADNVDTTYTYSNGQLVAPPPPSAPAQSTPAPDADTLNAAMQWISQQQGAPAAVSTYATAVAAVSATPVKSTGVTP